MPPGGKKRIVRWSAGGEGHLNSSMAEHEEKMCCVFNISGRKTLPSVDQNCALFGQGFLDEFFCEKKPENSAPKRRNEILGLGALGPTLCTPAVCLVSSGWRSLPPWAFVFVCASGGRATAPRPLGQSRPSKAASPPPKARTPSSDRVSGSY